MNNVAAWNNWSFYLSALRRRWSFFFFSKSIHRSFIWRQISPHQPLNHVNAFQATESQVWLELKRTD